MNIQKLESIENLVTLKQQYIGQTTAPLDGMWLCGFVPTATHFGFYEENKLVGFYCINDDGYLLQFFLTTQYRHQQSYLFAEVLKEQHTNIGNVNGAFVSTAEPIFLSLCLDNFPTFQVNALMYQREKNAGNLDPRDNILPLQVLTLQQLSLAVEFAKNAIGAPEQWLLGYYDGLINRQELFGYWNRESLLALGEARGYDDYQTKYADLGVMVAVSERGKGLATNMLKHLSVITETKGLIPICSTEKDNIAAQKAIARAGFFASNRIVQFKL